MQSQANTVVAYPVELADDRRQATLANLPAGYQEVIQFGMITHVVLFSLLAKIQPIASRRCIWIWPRKSSTCHCI